MTITIINGPHKSNFFTATILIFFMPSCSVNQLPHALVRNFLVSVCCRQGMAVTKLSTSSESWVDTLNGKWTPLLFLVFGIVAFFGPMYFSSIECRVPREFTTHDTATTKSQCYEATKIRKFSPRLPDTDPNKVSEVYLGDGYKDGERTLYQYVSLILILQALFLRIPFIVWKLGERRLGIHYCVNTQHQGDDRKSVGRRLAVYLDQWIQHRKVNILSLGAFTIFHSFIKLLYFVNASMHLGLLDSFLKHENETSFGSQILGNIRENKSVFQSSPAFPRNAICTFSIPLLQKDQWFTVQCSFPFNPYLEQIMAVAWWWLMFSVAATVADGLFHVCGAIFPFFRVWFVKSNLMKLDLENSNQVLTDRSIQQFANDTLGEDVISFLKQVQETENGCVVMETVTELWKICNGITQPSPAIVTYSVQHPSSRPNCPTVQYHKQTGDIQDGSEAYKGEGHQPTAPLLYPPVMAGTQ
ncbi:innexin-11-like [Ostrea edulis]|uniref:innexin-11-like n=1 Tax=Ostrea edulis TaxID=37623 RepID=UPI002095E29C|nr:innexin-11-like [Ostrea edulis]